LALNKIEHFSKVSISKFFLQMYFIQFGKTKGGLMKTTIIFLVLIGGYFLLQLYILPKLGIQT